MEKINIAELLKDCPKGMELDCALYENLYFDYVREHAIYPIVCYTVDNKGEKISISFNWYGKHTPVDTAKCVIFPKGKTTWEGFQRPFKDGDILVGKANQPFIFQSFNRGNGCISYCGIDTCELFHLYSDDWTFANSLRFATEEEKEKLFQAIKDNGYKWNAETKTLEKLAEPKFKVGDKVLWNYDTKQTCTISKVTFTENRGYVYLIYSEGSSSGWWGENELTSIPNKFDIAILKPFDKVLVRCSSLDKWHIQFFEKYDKTCKYPFICIGYNKYKQCIPYEGNEHLFDKNDKCDNFYNTWEE